MKRILLTLVLLLCTLSYAQIDTLNYLKQFEVNKEKYIGKPFSTLLKDMKKIQPTTARGGVGKIKVLNSTFTFSKRENMFKEGFPRLLIFWQKPVPTSKVDYYRSKNDFHFTQEERKFYGEQIIKDMSVYSYYDE